MRHVQTVSFGEDGILIEYTDDADGDAEDFGQIHHLWMGKSFLARHPQVGYDAKETLDSANALVEAAMMAKMGGP